MPILYGLLDNTWLVQGIRNTHLYIATLLPRHWCNHVAWGGLGHEVFNVELGVLCASPLSSFDLSLNTAVAKNNAQVQIMSAQQSIPHTSPLLTFLCNIDACLEDSLLEVAGGSHNGERSEVSSGMPTIT
jgi:hypothetical protein